MYNNTIIFNTGNFPEYSSDRFDIIPFFKKGDNVKTIGGVFGKVTGVKDDRVVVQIAENVKVEVAKDAVSAKEE